MNHFRKRPFIAMGCYYFAAITLLAAVIVKAQPDVTLIGPPIGLPVGNVAPGYRGLPHLVMAGSSFEVTIAVTPDVTASVYAVEDHIPENATVTDISDNGSLDAINGLVKWGPFFDNQSRTLTYSVRIAEGETGKLSFSGSVSVDGVPSMIEGSDAVEIFSDFPVVNPPIDPPVAPPSGVVSPAFRTLPLVKQAGDSIQVNIGVAPGDEASVYAVEDRIPMGATAMLISDNGSFDAVNGLVKWGPFFDNQSRALSYMVLLARGQTGEVTFSGSVSVDGVASVIDGNDVVEIEAFFPPIDPPVVSPSPAFRTLPLIAQAGSRLEVSILAAPGVGTSVYAVEDRIPVGATATEISDNGSFDAANGLVKWGPFFDNQSRSLSYVVQLAGGETGEVTFSGSVSVDGVASVIDGNNVVEIDDVRLPGSFGLEYPPSEQVFLKNAQPVKFSWKESSGATSYEVLVAKQGDAQVSVWATGVTTPEWSVDRDIGLGRWYWKVRARNGSGVAESGTFNFEVLEEMNQPEAFAAVSPAQGQVFQGNPAGLILKWNPARNATRYEVFLGKDESSAMRLVSRNLVEPQYKVNEPLEVGKWYWKVVAYNWLGKSETTVNVFEVKEVSIPPDNVSPGIRTLPSKVSADTQFKVSIVVSPESATSAYAVEEQIPEGVTVSQISDNGSLDSSNGRVKWGPFFDDSPRSLSYLITISSNAAEVLEFTGSVSIDGVSVTTAGDVSVLVSNDSSVIQVPQWGLPTGFQYSMVIHAKVDGIESIPGTSGSLLSAWKDDEIRGVAEAFDGPAGRQFQLNMFSRSSTESGFRLKAFNAAKGDILELSPGIEFSSDGTLGSIGNPKTFSANQADLVMSVEQGWNWLSINLEPEITNIGAVMEGFEASNDDVVKSSSGSATYFEGQWFPADFEILPGRLYKLLKQSEGASMVKVSGKKLTTSASIPLVAGWNWIGYLGHSMGDVDAMRHSSGFQNNDTIKSQQGSATFFGGSWFATSAFQLRPGKGYLLNVADSGELTFIDGELEGSSSARPRIATLMEEMGDSPDWVSPSGFQDSMLVHAVVEIDGERLNTEGAKLAGFANGEIRGVSDIFAGPAGSQFQLNLFSNSDSSDNMIPKVFIPGVGVIDLSPKLEFNSDKLHGSIASPIILKGTLRGNPYESWAQENLIDVTETLRAPWQDADNDGLINHVEFALGMDPLIPDSSAVLRISQESEAVFLEYTRPVGGVEGVAYRMEGSSDLVNWTPLEISKIEPGEANKEKVVYSVVAQSTGFYRLTIR